MKTYLKNIVIPAVSAIIGGTAVLAATKVSPSFRSKAENTSPKKQSVAPIFSDNFFAQNQPFADLEKMQQQMDKSMKEFEDSMPMVTVPFDPIFSNKIDTAGINEVSKREDRRYVYYDINVGNAKSMAINTKIKDGYITITGTREKKTTSTRSRDNNKVASESFFKSMFSRTFPLPADVYANKMKVLRGKNKIVLRFPKLRA